MLLQESPKHFKTKIVVLKKMQNLKIINTKNVHSAENCISTIIVDQMFQMVLSKDVLKKMFLRLKKRHFAYV